ncbi:uncharacterized protein PITG_04191 [Phytophthora infestans T30-4]|uniref:Uncharacterized protein n=1 Tax=Phytophthora infestans (strain T30-4) TaxID=403677 RepID=D0N0R5_PHYIT|nr:uncharacterized protein PITG_04191 [Phytophthora infestans T30-4]EEY67228.1 hypothetical protein PITG_04191 [Phytophthora infestans T30-4]|eukprot:XP_002905876.1 hypothetical protein PITG_04191 [Phytophthora infestans T30-4]
MARTFSIVPSRNAHDTFRKGVVAIQITFPITALPTTLIASATSNSIAQFASFAHFANAPNIAIDCQVASPQQQLLQTVSR